MKATIFQIVCLQHSSLVNKCVSGLIMNTNLKNLHHKQVTIFSSFSNNFMTLNLDQKSPARISTPGPG